MSASKPSDPDYVSFRSWLAVFGGVIGAFMAVLDIQITNASIKDITGALGSTLDEGSWISTAYLAAEIVIIPLTGWLSDMLSLRRYIMITTVCFLISSVCCGLAWNLESMIFFRACQGFSGGALIPLAFQVILTKLPPSKRSVGLALFGFTATFAPAIGPTVGGYLTESFGWSTIFLINLIPGALLLWIVWYSLDAEKPRFELLKSLDLWGILTMAVGLSCFTIFLEDGQREDWFGSHFIIWLAIIAFVSLTAFFIIEFTHKNPFINLRLLQERNFGMASLVNLSLGVSMYGCLYLLPLYLSLLQGYNSIQIGKTVMWSGMPQLFVLPCVPWLLKKFDARLLVWVGVSLFGVSCFMNSFMTFQTAIDQLKWSQFVRALGQPLIIVPLSAIATGLIRKEQAGSASGLFNMIRNLGGSVGIALLSTLLSNREQLHSNRIGEAISIYSFQTQQRITSLVSGLVPSGIDPVSAVYKSVGIVDATVRRESYVMAFDDCFRLVAFLLFLSGLIVLFCKRVKASSEAPVH